MIMAPVSLNTSPKVRKSFLILAPQAAVAHHGMNIFFGLEKNSSKLPTMADQSMESIQKCSPLFFLVMWKINTMHYQVF